MGCLFLSNKNCGFFYQALTQILIFLQQRTSFCATVITIGVWVSDCSLTYHITYCSILSLT